MRTPLLAVMLPDGRVVTRRTDRRYTHVVAARRQSGAWSPWTWTTQPARALARNKVHIAEIARTPQDIVELRIVPLALAWCACGWPRPLFAVTRTDGGRPRESLSVRYDCPTCGKAYACGEIQLSAALQSPRARKLSQ